ncbi:hypothetical protein [Bifidobacterium miconisargentati]|uniref:hypothetical protein n=1 Tax=Bifidobacterium miconisargentati TaxID=2834437 RepID=UPI001BDC5F3B|nr:hypothetical protein [Bifidobacterium miconisargentati]MBW3090087.1 hypothetical protein [Bifidobacterium miconisargentati]
MMVSTELIQPVDDLFIEGWSADAITHGLKEVGGGNMGEGVRRIAQTAFDAGRIRGFSEGRVCGITTGRMQGAVITGLAFVGIGAVAYFLVPGIRRNGDSEDGGRENEESQQTSTNSN